MHYICTKVLECAVAVLPCCCNQPVHCLKPSVFNFLDTLKKKSAFVSSCLQKIAENKYTKNLMNFQWLALPLFEKLQQLN